MKTRFIALAVAMLAATASATVIAATDLTGSLISQARLTPDAYACTYGVAYKNTHVKVTTVASVCRQESKITVDAAEAAYKTAQ